MTAVRWDMPAPIHWPRTRVKYVCRFVGGGTPDKGNIEYWNGEIPWVSPKDMKSSEIVDTEDHITKAGLDSSAAKLPLDLRKLSHTSMINSHRTSKSVKPSAARSACIPRSPFGNSLPTH